MVKCGYPQGIGYEYGIPVRRTDAGGPQGLSAMTLDQYLHGIYAPSHLGIAATSVDQMAIAVRLFNRWAGRSVTIEELDDVLVLKFLGDYLKEGHSPATVNAKRRHLLAVWRDAHRRGYCPRLPTHIPRLKEYLQLPQAWRVDEIERILAAARTIPGTITGVPACRWWPSILLACFDSGGRIGAIRQVRPSDVRLADRGMVLRAETQKDHRARWCSLHDQTIAACAAIHADSRELMWPWDFSREWLDQSFRKLLRRAGVQYGREKGGLWHKLRRTSGTLVEANGGDGSRHLGNTRQVFETHYNDPTISSKSQLDLLPRPNLNNPQLRLF